MRSPEEQAVATAIIGLMRGVVYRESHEDAWATLERHAHAVRDHFATIGVHVVIDDTEGYAYLRTRDDDDAEPLRRLVHRRSRRWTTSWSSSRGVMSSGRVPPAGTPRCPSAP